MSVIGGQVLTMADWAKRLDPDGKTPDIVEMLSQTNPILDDMLFKEGNLPTGERTTIRTGLPSVYWRLINQGVPPSKSNTAQVDEHTGMLEAWSEVDEELANLNGNVAAFRLSEAQAFIEAMNQEMAQTLFYGNSSTAPEEFNGLSVRYSTIAGAANGQNVLNAGGTGTDNTSIWLVAWGSNTVQGIFPRGSKAGLEHNDYGVVTVETTAGIAGNRMRAYQDHWKWKCGLALKDWRYCVRIANIDVSAMLAGTGPNLADLMIRATHRLPNMNMGKPVFYMNRSVFQIMDIQRLAAVAAGGGLTFENAEGEQVTNFRGIPVKITDALLDTEAAVV